MSVNLSAQHYDVACLGKAMVDVIFTQLPRPPSANEELYTNSYKMDIGGNATLTAIALSNLSVKATLLTAVGNDHFGKYVINRLKTYGIGLECLQITTESTDLSMEMSFPDNRATATALIQGNRVDINKRVKKLVSLCRHLHIAGPIKDREVELLEFAASHGLTTSLDTSLVNKDQEHTILEALPYVDLLMPNLSEVLGWDGIRDIHNVVMHLATQIRANGYCIVKLGEKGSIASNGKSIIESGSFPASVIDTTGAGDAFNAGFIYGYLKHKDISTCMRLANAMGSLKVQKVGGAYGMPTIKDLCQLMEEHK